ncbi:DUF927 domain-containing protein [Escherichia coli]|nr:DUF927 domain-containing protein [Escherichia coli]
MSTVLDFLHSVLPASGNFFCAAAIEPNSGKTKLYAVTSHEKLARLVQEIANNRLDAYFALAAFEQNWHDDPKGRPGKDGAVKQVFRTQENAYAMRALWLDLDVGPDDPKKYPSQGAAINGITEFCNRTGMPKPCLVSSGGGIHVYWCFTNDISAAQWNVLSSALDAVLRHMGVPVDPARTMDGASVLRPVGTINWKEKYGPGGAPVALISHGDIVHVDVVVNALSRYMDTHGIVRTQKSPARQTVTAAHNSLQHLMNNPAFMAAMGHVMQEAKDKDPALITSECRQIREAGLEAEPTWHRMMSVMVCCFGGEIAARIISAYDKRRFNEQQFINKFRYVESSSRGPASCQEFNRLCPGKCDTCPHFGKITSPAELGRTQRNIMPLATQAQTQIQVASVTTAAPGKPVTTPTPVSPQGPIDLSSVPFVAGFSQVPGQGLYYHKPEKDENGNITYLKKLVMPRCIFLVGKQEIHISFAQMQTVYIWKIVSQTGEVRQAQMLAEDQATPSALSKWCANNQLLTEGVLDEHRNRYMRSLLAQMIDTIPSVRVADQFGWTEASLGRNGSVRGFILGNTMLMPNMLPTQVAINASLEQFGRSRYTATGSLELWKQIPAACSRYNWLPMQVALSLGFASVLMEFAVGSTQNIIVNFCGPSGSGKTTAMRAALSIWGNPERQMTRPQDTNNSQARIAGLSRSVPNGLDDVTKLEPKDLSDTVFSLSEGREKHRLEKNSALLQGQEWKKVTIMTSNTSVLDALVPFAPDRDAEVKRVLELFMPRVPDRPAEEIAEMQRLERVMQQNYGQAGTAFVQWLMDTPGMIDRLPGLLDKMQMKFTEYQDERFWSATLAAVAVVVPMTNAAGLTAFDVKQIISFMLEHRNSMRKQLLNSKVDGGSLLSDFLSDSLRNTLIVTDKDRPVTVNGDMPLHQDAYVLRVPSMAGNLDVRIERDQQVAYVRCAAFHKWCKDRNTTPRHVLSELAVSGVYDARVNGGKGYINMRLGRSISALAQIAPSRVYTFKLDKEGIDVDVLASKTAKSEADDDEVHYQAEQS